MHCLRPWKSAPLLYCVERKECHPAVPVFFQKFDHFLGCLLGIRDYILNRSSESSLHGKFIFFPDFHDIGYSTDDTRISLLLLHHPLDAESISLIAFRHVS